MQISDLDYELPGELIAQQPLKRREASRMLVVDRDSCDFVDGAFADLPRYLRKGDVLVLNDTRVFPARLYGRTATGANVEIFLIREMANGSWESLARPGRRLAVGKTIAFGDKLTAAVIEKGEGGKINVRFESQGDFYDILDEIGRTPLPPYIKRDESVSEIDRDRYQTVYAASRGAIAAPTAGLHFTPEVLDAVGSVGVTIARVTLHVGYGTFEPVRVENLTDHRVAPESYEISAETSGVLTRAISDGVRVIAVGTTTTRALESNLSDFGRITTGNHAADLTITPGYRFKAISALLTNFHLPRSSLLILTSTFGGRELIMNAYRYAVKSKYRFYSYGDCMLIV